MKQIIRATWSKTIDQERNEMELAWARQQSIESELFPKFPKNVNATFYFSAELSQTIRCWITIEPTYNEDGKRIDADPFETSALKMFAQAFTGNEGRRALREKSGTVYYVFQQERNDHGSYQFWLLIENCHPGTCKIEKVTKEVEVFEITC